MYESKQLLFSTISLTMFKKPQIFDWLNLPQVLQIQITVFWIILLDKKTPSQFLRKFSLPGILSKIILLKQ